MRVDKKRKIEETGVNQQPKCKPFFYHSISNLSGLINIDILNVNECKANLCNKIFGMQLIATDNNLDSSLSLYKQNKHSVCRNAHFLSFNFQTKQILVGQCRDPCEHTAKFAWGWWFSPSRDIHSFLLK